MFHFFLSSSSYKIETHCFYRCLRQNDISIVMEMESVGSFNNKTNEILTVWKQSNKTAPDNLYFEMFSFVELKIYFTNSLRTTIIKFVDDKDSFAVQNLYAPYIFFRMFCCRFVVALLWFRSYTPFHLNDKKVHET